MTIVETVGEEEAVGLLVKLKVSKELRVRTGCMCRAVRHSSGSTDGIQPAERASFSMLDDCCLFCHRSRRWADNFALFIEFDERYKKGIEVKPGKYVTCMHPCLHHKPVMAKPQIGSEYCM